jgi:hypothetical protein
MTKISPVPKHNIIAWYRERLNLRRLQKSVLVESGRSASRSSRCARWGGTLGTSWMGDFQDPDVLDVETHGEVAVPTGN